MKLAMNPIANAEAIENRWLRIGRPRLRNLPIPTKLTILTAVTLTVALLVFSAVLSLYNRSEARASKVAQLTTLAEVLASNSTAAITFEQNASLERLLMSLERHPSVAEALVFKPDGAKLASYDLAKDGLTIGTELPLDFEFEFANGTLLVQVPIIDDGEHIGTILVSESLAELDAAAWGYVKMTVAAVFMSLLLGIGAAIPLQRSISNPIIRLATTAQEISRDMDFSIRVHHSASDEIGVLYREFNNMIERVQLGSQETQEAKRALEVLNAELEGRVIRRTLLLQSANESLQHRIYERDQVNEELKNTQTRLIEISRKAGMAEIANGVLHNIGNVLNSLNVSASVVEEKVTLMGVDRLRQCVELIRQNESDLGTFMSTTPKGQMIPQFLHALATSLETSRELVRKEIWSLMKNIEHMKDIVRAQQSHAGAFGVIEVCEAGELMEDAIKFNTDSMERHKVCLTKSYGHLEPLEIERTPLIQMLVNLIKNAKESVMANPNREPEIFVSIQPETNDRVRFEVRDTGVGISQEDLTKVFSHGYTTKQDGHGFGLHASANLAREMGGQLSVLSAGVGQGATFVLQIPRLQRQSSTTKTEKSALPPKRESPVFEMPLSKMQVPSPSGI
jgi:signal transduction histidine kinase